MIDNQLFSIRLNIFKGELEHIGVRSLKILEAGVPVSEQNTYKYLVEESKDLINWTAYWLYQGGQTRTPGNFLLFYSALVLKNSVYSADPVKEHMRRGNAEFYKYTSALMEALVSCIR